MLSRLFLFLSGIAFLFSVLITKKVVQHKRMIKKLSFSALMLSLFNFALLHFIEALRFIFPSELPSFGLFMNSLTLTLLLMAYGGEYFHAFS